MLFIAKLNPEFLSWVLQKNQSNLELSLVFVSRQEKDYYSFVSVEQLSFDCGDATFCKATNDKNILTDNPQAHLKVSKI